WRVARLGPLGLSAIACGAAGMGMTASGLFASSGLAVAGFQSLICLSAPKLASFVASALTLRPKTGASWAGNVLISLPSAAFHHLIDLSSPQEMISPFGVNRAWRIAPTCAFCQSNDDIQTRANLSAPALTTRLASRNAAAWTGP